MLRTRASIHAAKLAEAVISGAFEDAGKWVRLIRRGGQWSRLVTRDKNIWLAGEEAWNFLTAPEGEWYSSRARWSCMALQEVDEVRQKALRLFGEVLNAEVCHRGRSTVSSTGPESLGVVPEVYSADEARRGGTEWGYQRLPGREPLRQEPVEDVTAGAGVEGARAASVGAIESRCAECEIVADGGESRGSAAEVCVEECACTARTAGADGARTV